MPFEPETSSPSWPRLPFWVVGPRTAGSGAIAKAGATRAAGRRIRTAIPAFPAIRARGAGTPGTTKRTFTLATHVEAVFVAYLEYTHVFATGAA